VAVDGPQTWALDGRAVLRNDGVGPIFEPPVGPPIDEPRDLLVEPDGVVLVAAQGGAWVSRDGGTTFGPLGDVGVGVSGHALARGGARLWLATDQGLRVLIAQEDDTSAVVRSEGDLPPLPVLQDAASRRVPTPTSRARTPSWLVPQLSLEGRWSTDRGRSFAPIGGGASGSLDLYAALAWRPPAGSGAGGSPLVALADVDGTVQVFGGPFDAWVLLARVGRRIHDERLRAVDRVGELVTQRGRLLTERTAAGRTVREAVATELRIAEVEAWIDVVTDGALTRWRAAGAGGAG
jgi:hypothetical protein